MKTLSAKWVGVMVGSAAVAAFAIGVLLVGITGLFPRAKADDQDTIPVFTGPGTSPFVAVVDEVLPAVVNISSSQKIVIENSPFNDPFFKEFFGDILPETPREQTQYNLGSGVIFRSDGYILTNNHVIADADEITVTLHDGRTYPSDKIKLIGRDPQTDLAVLKIQTTDNLPYARLGDSDSIRVGDWAIAIGIPFGLEGTVTVGVISAKGRSGIPLSSDQRYQNFIQTDASINVGNSGGPLCGISGEVIGINTAITSPTGYSVGVGFAIPANTAKYVSSQLIEKGKVERGYLGVYPQELDSDLRQSLGLKNNDGGVLVADVIPDTPAQKAGLESGDVILTINGGKVLGQEKFRQMVAEFAPGTSIELEIWRDGARKKVKVTLEEFPEQEIVASNTPGTDQSGVPFGLVVRSLSSSERQAMGVSGGVLVESVRSGSPATASGIITGDVILKLDNKKVNDADNFYQVAEDIISAKKSIVMVQLYRQGRRYFVSLRTG